MDVEGFCVAISDLGLCQADQAVAILWFFDKEGAPACAAGTLARLIRQSGLGNPHSTQLGESVIKTGHVIKAGDRFRIKPTSRAKVAEWVKPVMTAKPPEVDHGAGFLPEALWDGAHSYIVKIAKQINGCYQNAFYDGAAVLLRRLIETLLIECYEHLKIADKIKRNDEYVMLNDILNAAVDQGQLSLGRDTKKALKEIKIVGDRSAHSRRYVACKNDLDKIQLAARVAIDDLLHLSKQK
jgi:hypothetical protein